MPVAEIQTPLPNQTDRLSGSPLLFACWGCLLQLIQGLGLRLRGK